MKLDNVQRTCKVLLQMRQGPQRVDSRTRDGCLCGSLQLHPLRKSLLLHIQRPRAHVHVLGLRIQITFLGCQGVLPLCQSFKLTGDGALFARKRVLLLDQCSLALLQLGLATANIFVGFFQTLGKRLRLVILISGTFALGGTAGSVIYSVDLGPP